MQCTKPPQNAFLHAVYTLRINISALSLSLVIRSKLSELSTPLHSSPLYFTSRILLGHIILLLKQVSLDFTIL